MNATPDAQKGLIIADVVAVEAGRSPRGRLNSFPGGFPDIAGTMRANLAATTQHSGRAFTGRRRFLVTKNGLPLVDYANTLHRRDGKNKRRSRAARRASARSS
jgi:hypothetical protein